MPVTISQPATTARDLLTQSEAIARAAAIHDVQYDLELGLNARAETFTGRITISFQLDPNPPAGSTFLCFRGRTIESLRINGALIDAPDWNGYRINLPLAALKRGAANTIEVTYENAYDAGGDGVFRTIDPEDGAEYVYTNFEPYESHRMAPLFNQPDIKARLALRILAPAEWTVLANSPELSRGATDATGRALRTFAETPPLSAYLFAMAAGAYVGRQFAVPVPGRAEPLPVGLWSRRSLERYLSYDLFETMTAQALAYYGELFGRVYPFEKLDHVFCAEFNPGAMENVGLITYGEGYLFRSTPTPSDITDLAEVVFHEIAHMWFGNLVTMRWWNDLWLNESFATYASYLCLTEGSEHTGAWREFNMQLKRWALAEDDAPTTHPIAGSVDDTDQTFLNFDGITYGKGGAVLKQLGARLGRAGFSAGLRLHFERHAFGNATLDEFLASLQEGSGVDLSAWSKQWLQTSGPNRLGARIEPDTDGKIRRLLVTQEVASGDDVLREHLLKVALLQAAPNGRIAIEAHEVLVNGAETEVPTAVGRPLPLGVVANHEDLAVGKLELDPTTIALVAERLEDIPDSLLRQVIWGALWEAVRDGRYPMTAYARLLETRLPKEPDSAIVQQVIAMTMGPLLMRWLPDGEREVWGSRFVAAARARLAEGGDEGLLIVWSRALVTAAVTPRDVEEGWQVATGETPLEGAEIDQDHRWALLIRGASLGLPQTAERLRGEVLRDPSDRGARALLSAAAAEPSVAVKRATWERLFSHEGYGSVKKTLAAGAGFAWPWQRELLAPYVAKLPAALLVLGSADPTLARDLVTRAMPLSLWGDPAGLATAATMALAQIEDPASTIPAVDGARLRRFALAERDSLERIIRQRRSGAAS
jgi:aminopeptidase N